MSYTKQFFKLLAPLFILNVISNHLCMGEPVFTEQPAVLVWCEFLCICAFVATVEAAVIAAFYSLNRIFGKVTFGILVGLYTLLFAIDIFVLLQFGMIIGESAVRIFCESNYEEAVGFIDNYLNWKTAVSIICPIISIILVRLSFKAANIKPVRVFLLCLSLLGLAFSLFCVNNYKKGISTKGIVLMVSPIRTAVSFITNDIEIRGEANLAEVCEKHYDCEFKEGAKAFERIIIVIGESHSVYHTSLYGYEKETFPNMHKLYEKDSLFVFKDICSPYDLTNDVMPTLFSVDENDLYSAPLFPVFLRDAGYYIQLLDNEYAIGRGGGFLSNERISNALFKDRNAQGVRYDGNLMPEIVDTASRSVTILHLLGQHLPYQNRYPDSFSIFKADDYDKAQYTYRQRMQLAAYDNSCLYTDFLLQQLIDKYKERDAIMFYLSDHGEELYELSDYNGHGSAIQSSDIQYQLRVPFFIWMSESARKTRPELSEKLSQSEHFPMISSDFPHLVLDIAGVSNTFIDKTRSFVSPSYDISKPRIVLGYIDYDKYCKSHLDQ